MSEFKGTPGPWRVDDNGVFYDVQTYSGINIGDVCASQHTFDESVHHGLVATANANLIAAAPELLEALQDALHAHDKHGEHSEWDFARAAIAKALDQ